MYCQVRLNNGVGKGDVRNMRHDLGQTSVIPRESRPSVHAPTTKYKPGFLYVHGVLRAPLEGKEEFTLTEKQLTNLYDALADSLLEKMEIKDFREVITNTRNEPDYTLKQVVDNDVSLWGSEGLDSRTKDYLHEKLCEEERKVEEEERLAAEKAEEERLAVVKAEEDRLAVIKEEERLAAEKAQAEKERLEATPKRLLNDEELDAILESLQNDEDAGDEGEGDEGDEGDDDDMYSYDFKNYRDLKRFLANDADMITKINDKQEKVEEFTKKNEKDLNRFKELLKVKIEEAELKFERATGRTGNYVGCYSKTVTCLQ